MRRLSWVWILFGVVLVLLLFAALFGPPVILRWDLGRRAEQLSPTDTAGAINQIRSAIVQGVGAVVVLIGAYVAWQQLQQNMRATQTQIELQRAGTVTERYTRVLDQLSSKDETIRVGAIHALNRIAAEAPTERAGVVALLASYVRVRAHRGWLVSDGQHLPLRSRASDLQAALTALTFWIQAGQVPSQWLSADLAHTDLPNANLHRCTLWHVRLRDTDLTGADLSESDLRGADLREVRTDRANFRGALANRRTWWPSGFDPVAQGILIEESEAAYVGWPPKTPDA